MITIIVATDDQLLIGRQDTRNGLPWNVPEDLAHFKKTTLHQTILMGLNTYRAIGRPLPHRKTIVVSLEPFEDERVEVRGDLLEVIEEYKNNQQDLYICGGASIYAQALPEADRLLLSRIPGTHIGETYFPDFQRYGYQLYQTIPFETFTLEEYRR
ncbi:MAG: dihydrofolate reductase [bacterium]